MTPHPRAGLCSLCVHARTVVSGKGSTFWMCGRAATDARFRKYPPLPVLRCPGFEPEDAGDSRPGQPLRPA
jgi:hypothetical protein